MNLESEVSNIKDFEIWANKSGWFKLRQYFVTRGTNTHWVTPTGREFWVCSSSEGTIIDWLEGKLEV
jgi:hypothetical protein